MADVRQSERTVNDEESTRKYKKMNDKGKVPVRINSKGAVRPRIYSSFPESSTSQNCNTQNTMQDGTIEDIQEQALQEEGQSKDSSSEKGDEGRDYHSENPSDHEENERTLADLMREFQGSLPSFQEYNDTACTDQADSEEETEEGEEIEEGEETEEDGTEESENEHGKGDEPIYSGHPLTLNTSLVLIFVFAMVHSITGSELNDLLTLISIHCLHSNPVYASVKRFKAYFASMKSPIVKHFFCSRCFFSVTENDSVCPNELCSSDMKKKKNKSYFIEFPVKSQIEQFFKRENFISDIQHRFRRKKKSPHGIEDIYDGSIYKSFSSLNAEEMPYNLSFTWNTDGVPLFKSSKISIWPVYLMINELPYKMRKKKENMLFYGLWFGDLKPLTTLFFTPLHKHLQHLETDGLEIMVRDQIVNVKCYLICGTADLPARSTVLNMVQFNGASSCLRCVQKGRTEMTGQRGHTHIFPFCEEDPVGEKREKGQCLTNAAEATSIIEPVNGIKGPSFLMGLKSYDFVKSTAIDYMHCVLLGVTKRFLTLWFTPQFSKFDFSLLKYLSTVDERLTQIKPTYTITRRPRSISNHLKFWKASELRSWLLFYSVPILVDLLPSVYFFHYCSLVEAIWRMNKNCVTIEDINQSRVLLYYFVYMLDTLYGARYLTLNFHSLLHIPECVQDLGPLWVYSCFPFESLNGELTKLFHGTQAFDTQIVSAVNMHQILPKLIDTIPDAYKQLSVMKTYIGSAKTALGIQLDHDVFVVGSHSLFHLDDADYALLVKYLKKEPIHLTMYLRLFLRSQLLQSARYERVSCRNSFTVKYVSMKQQCNSIKFGYVQYFLVHRNDQCMCQSVCGCEKQILVCINVLREAGSVVQGGNDDNPEYLNLSLPHLHKCSVSEEVEFIEVHNIMSLCVCVDFLINLERIVYVCELPNVIECD